MAKVKVQGHTRGVRLVAAVMAVLGAMLWAGMIAASIQGGVHNYVPFVVFSVSTLAVVIWGIVIATDSDEHEIEDRRQPGRGPTMSKPRYELVLRIVDKEALEKPLVWERASFAVPPVVGDAVQWHPDWGLLTVEYRYVFAEGVELGVGRIARAELQTFLDAGWEQR